MQMTSDTDERWYQVSFSVPWIVHRAETGQDAVNIAVSELGKGIADPPDDIRNIEIAVQTTACSDCESETYALLTISEKSLVGLTLSAEVQASSAEAGGQQAKRVLGQQLPDTPLTLVD